MKMIKQIFFVTLCVIGALSFPANQSGDSTTALPISTEYFPGANKSANPDLEADIPSNVNPNTTTIPTTTVPTTTVPTTTVPTTTVPTTTVPTTTVPTTTVPIITTPNTTVPTASTITPTNTTIVTPETPTSTTITTPSATTVPTPTAAPSKDRRFDGPSFLGGIVLSLGMMAIGFVAFKFYKARTERNYHTL